jgi:murein DD-endopeptidase MepM/ murein hydrolase activator NlpD
LVGGLGILLVGVVAAGTVAEHVAPTPTREPARGDWAQVAPHPTFAPNSTAPNGSPGATHAPAGRPTAVRHVFPVEGKVTYERTHHDYPASDIIAACGSAVLAVTDGVVLEVNRIDSYNAGIDDGAKRGGLFISVLGDDGVRYYGSHFRMLLAGVEAQVRVKAGEKLGEVGNSGDAGACHLHFGISPPCARTADWWTRRGTVWPWSYLDAWRRGDPVSPAPEVAAWNAKNGCPGAPH